MHDGTSLRESLDNPDAHYLGSRPFRRSEYVEKLETLSAEVVEQDEQGRFVDLVGSLPSLDQQQVTAINLQAKPGTLDDALDRLLAGKPLRHDFDIDRAEPALTRHMSATGG